MERAAITVRANRMIKNFSTAENLMAMEASTGVKSHRQMRLTMPPNREDTMPIFNALAPSPFFAMG